MQLTSLKPPSVYVQEKIGAQLKPLDATFVDARNNAGVEVRFADPKNTTVANSAFEDSLDGIKLLFRDSAGKDVQGVADGYTVLAAVSQMPGVAKTRVVTGSDPMQMEVLTDSAAAKTAIDTILRPETAMGESISVS